MESKKRIDNSTNEKIDNKNVDEFISMSAEDKRIMDYLEKIVQRKVICNRQVAIADYNGEAIVSSLFKKYYQNPRLLPEKTLWNIYIKMLQDDVESAININECNIKIADEEIDEWLYGTTDKDFKKRRILIRTITDYIAGMTDGYAIAEYKRLL